MADPLLTRIAAFDTPLVSITLDGEPVRVHTGQSVLAAILSCSNHVRRHELNGEPRAGFCLMGACQDCWVWFGENQRGRACTTQVAEGMEVSTSPIYPVRCGD